MNAQVFGGIKPVRTKYRDCHVFDIAGVEWDGDYWDSDQLRRLRRAEGEHWMEIWQARDGAGFFFDVRRRLADGVHARHSERTESLEDAVARATKFEFTTRLAAGATWYAESLRESYECWIAAFGAYDTGRVEGYSHSEIHYYTAKRHIGNPEGGTFLLEFSGPVSSGESGRRLLDFPSAALKCARLFDELLLARGGDAYAQGFRDGRAALRSQIFAITDSEGGSR